MSSIRNVLATLVNGAWVALMISTQMPGQSLEPAPPYEKLGLVSDTTIGTSAITTLVTGSFLLEQGDHRLLGRAEITSTSSVYTQAFIGCTDPDGKSVAQQTGAAENHRGKDATGPNYPVKGHLVLQPLLLFTAPKTGTYTCQLTATKGTTGDPAPGVHLTALGRVNGDPTTWLEVSGKAADTGRAFQDPSCDANGDTTPTAANDFSACLYLAGASNLKQIYVFDNGSDGDGSEAQVWFAPPETAFVDASASIMLTSCHYKTSSCPSDDSQSLWNYLEEAGTVNGGTVDTHLELIQLDPDGKPCMTSQTPEERWFVGNVAHHNMHYFSLSNVPVYPCNGSRQFKMRISVKYVTGVPLKLDGYSWTHGFVVTSATGTASPVPYLVGLQESTAASAITKAGYDLSTVSYVLNSAPPETVIDQSPSAGVIENPGSQVTLTLSTGGSIVPNLLGAPQSSATNAIRALSLTPIVGYSHACINPGEVLTQSPLAGTLLAFGSTVTLTIDNGTYKTCGVTK